MDICATVFLPHATEDDACDASLQDVLLVTKQPNNNPDNRVLVATSEKLVLQQDLESYTKIFVINNQPINVQEFMNSLNRCTEELNAKHFVQKSDGSWQHGICAGSVASVI